MLKLHPIRLDMDEEDGRRFPIRTLRAVVRRRRDGPVIYLRFGGWGSLCLGRDSLARARQLMEQLSEAILVAQEMRHDAAARSEQPTVDSPRTAGQTAQSPLPPVGGFQSGFHARRVPRSEAKHPQFLICSHGCGEIVQLVSHVSGEVELELCRAEARRMAEVLLGAAEAGSPPCAGDEDEDGGSDGE